MPPKITDADWTLMAQYQEAALRLQRALETARTVRDRKRVLAQVEAVLRELEELTHGYLAENIPAQFKAGSEEAIAELGKLRGFGAIDETFSAIHQEAVQQLANDATLKFARAIQGTRDAAEIKIGEALKQQLVNELIQSEIQGTAPRTKQVFQEAGITAFQSPSRGWSLDDYADMLTHSITAEAHNTGAMTRYLSNGVQYAQAIERVDAPDRLCQWMRDKIIWLGERRFIAPMHPRCFGGIKPYLGDPADAYRSLDDPRIPEDVRKLLLKR
jgi:hypothetical protein